MSDYESEFTTYKKPTLINYTETNTTYNNTKKEEMKTLKS